MKAPKDLIRMNKKYQTRSGLPVRVLCTDRKGSREGRAALPVVALVLREGFEDVIYYWGDGSIYSRNGAPHSLDLFEIEEGEDALV